MRTTTSILAAAACAAAFAAPAHASSARCGNLSGALANNVVNIKTENLSCAKGRQVARQWATMGCGHTCTTASGYRCKLSGTGEESAKVKCTRGSRVVRFETVS